MQTEWQFPNAATPPGSAAYYVARFAEPSDRDRIAAWLAWFAHIDAIAEKANDPGVARLKLDWWREETRFMRQKQARHPLGQVVSDYVLNDWQIEFMHQALGAIEQRILKQTPANLAELQQQCAQEQGSRFKLLSNSEATAIQRQAEWLGIYSAMVKRIQWLGRDVQQHYLSLPDAALSDFAIQRTQLEERKEVPHLAQAMQALLQPLEQKLRSELPGFRRQAVLHPPLRMAMQAYYLSRQMRKKAYASHQQWFELAPMQNLWAAWRMR